MDYDYGHSERQFEGNVVSYDAGEEQEDYEDTHHHHHHRQQQREDEIGSGGNERHQSFNIRDSSASSSSSAGKLFVGGLSWDTTEETFSSYFSKYGEITDAVIMMDRNTGRPRGFGFITFADPAAAERALEDEHVIDGRTVEVKRTVPKGDMEGKGVVRAKKIFIGGIPPSLTEDELREYFSSYGSIVDHQIMLDHKTGRSRGFGFVTFENEDAVERIFFEDKIHELGGKQVEIKKAEPKRPGGASVGGGDYGSASKSYGGFNDRSSGYGASHGSANQYGGKMGRGYDGYGSYNAYGGYGGSYAGNAAGFYGGYSGGYGFGYGYGGPMMYGAGGYGGGGYGNPSAYGSNAGYGGGKGYGKNVDNGNFGAGKGYGYGNSVGGGYGAGSNGGGSGSGSGGGGGSAPGRYHPYRK